MTKREGQVRVVYRMAFVYLAALTALACMSFLWSTTSHSGEPPAQLIADRKGSSNVAVNILIDRKANSAFIAAQDDSGYKGFIYDIIGRSGAGIEIRLNDKEIMGLWRVIRP